MERLDRRRFGALALGAMTGGTAGCAGGGSSAPAGGDSTRTSDEGTATASGDAGTPTPTPEPDTPAPPYRLTLVNEASRRIDVAVRVTTDSADEVLWSGTYSLAEGEERGVEVDVDPGVYALRCAMPDGPVETLFGHEWATGAEPRLVVRFDDGGVEFDPA